jgi:hypothetical protein
VVDGQSEPQVLGCVFVRVNGKLGSKRRDKVFGKDALGKLGWAKNQRNDKLVAQLSDEMLLLGESKQLVDNSDNNVVHEGSEVRVVLAVAICLDGAVDATTARHNTVDMLAAVTMVTELRPE